SSVADGRRNVLASESTGATAYARSVAARERRVSVEHPAPIATQAPRRRVPTHERRIGAAYARCPAECLAEGAGALLVARRRDPLAHGVRLGLPPRRAPDLEERPVAEIEVVVEALHRLERRLEPLLRALALRRREASRGDVEVLGAERERRLFFAAREDETRRAHGLAVPKRRLALGARGGHARAEDGATGRAALAAQLEVVVHVDVDGRPVGVD